MPSSSPGSAKRSAANGDSTGSSASAGWRRSTPRRTATAHRRRSKFSTPTTPVGTDARSRFLREAYIANKIGKGAVGVIDDDVDDDGSPYLVMDLLHGEPIDMLAQNAWGARRRCRGASYCPRDAGHP